MKNREINIDIEEKSAIKVCKKCGNPIRSKSKYNYCENCRREQAKFRREVLGAVGALGLAAVSVIPGIKHFTKK